MTAALHSDKAASHGRAGTAQFSCFRSATMSPRSLVLGAEQSRPGHSPTSQRTRGQRSPSAAGDPQGDQQALGTLGAQGQSPCCSLATRNRGGGHQEKTRVHLPSWPSTQGHPQDHPSGLSERGSLRRGQGRRTSHLQSLLCLWNTGAPCPPGLVNTWLSLGQDSPRPPPCVTAGKAQG